MTIIVYIRKILRPGKNIKTLSHSDDMDIYKLMIFTDHDSSSYITK